MIGRWEKLRHQKPVPQSKWEKKNIVYILTKREMSKILDWILPFLLVRKPLLHTNYKIIKLIMTKEAAKLSTEDSNQNSDVAKHSPVKRRCHRKTSKTEETKSRYFTNRKMETSQIVFSGKVDRWTPPKSPYNLIQVFLFNKKMF